MRQKLVPGIVGISTYVDFAYQKAMQLAAVEAAGADGPINRLRSVVVTLDFHLLIENLRANKRADAEAQVTEAIDTLARAGADFIVVTSGTTSTLAGPARERVKLPFLDLAASCFKPKPPAAPVGLLATGYTVKAGQFDAAAGAKMTVPKDKTQQRVDQAIFGDLVRGNPGRASIDIFREALAELTAAGAKSVILGNTDLTLVATELQRTCTVPLIDSTTSHARDAARAALSGSV
ncbi:MAG TPA: aspartate/glutamate racemase family protein [Pseudolabrys sp.]|jgi:aspartate racemase|nr:aspartate/glutamate racemase family protein [Pseudolabrys sp.]